MDDLAGLDWSQPSQKPAAIRSTPLSTLPTQSTSARASPANPTPFKAPSKPATPANDSFAALVATNKSKAPAAALSLQERQKQLQEEKRREEAERRRQFDSTFGGPDSSHWDTIAGSRGTTQPVAFNTTLPHAVPSPSGEDLLAAFNSAAPVDKSSHFPIPVPNSRQTTPAHSHNVSGRQTPLPLPPDTCNNALDDDDDMFGLKRMAPTPAPPAPASHATHVADEDDILGLLSKPVSDFQNNEHPAPARELPEARRASPSPQTAHDQAVAELVDMGFSIEKSAIALATTDSGLDVQAAVGWLLNQAHADAKNRTRRHSQDRSQGAESHHRTRRGNHGPAARDESREARLSGRQPAWMRDEEARSQPAQRRQEGQSQEKDVTQMASEIGNTLFKSANSLWKTGRKQVQKAMADLNQEGDPTLPKWMRDAQAAEAALRSNEPSKPGLAATDEAMMLDAGVRPNRPTRAKNSRQEDGPPLHRRDEAIGRNGTPDRMLSQSSAQRNQPVHLEKRPATRLTRQEVEEKSAQAYISPARRKKTTPQPQADLFTRESATPLQSPPQPTPSLSKNPFLQPKATNPVSMPSPTRPKLPPRHIPPVSSSALNASAADRQKGSQAFKRGDFAAAHAAYSSALSPLPQSHPVTIIVLCNRAVTNIKVGDPKAAIADADSALTIIGVSRGEGERIATGGMEGDKDMREFYGKALMRKAEALENMEKWSEAYQVWKEAVQNGVGGAISISGRNRCAKAGSGGPVPAAITSKRSAPIRKPVPKPSALSDLGGAVQDSEAVKRMKAANAAADRAEDEKFALTDQVDGKLIAWKGTKSDNLRALLGSLDKVLWDEAGWKKVNMGDLVMPNKVKIIYMKAIAKVHPDKIPQTATTEQKMISAAVFATLNEAWDKFKSDNNL